jgi:hypothetical protein
MTMNLFVRPLKRRSRKFRQLTPHPERGWRMHRSWQDAEEVLRDVILSDAKNLAIKRTKDVRDPSSPSAPQDDTHCTFCSTRLGEGGPQACGYTE